ncbi:MAG: phosphate acyltransferase PlsX [Alphaproteobacteria bacterium]|nr:phosphate acyltransferase PlsX [Alphaproteobacteria bacterium]MCK5659533.1 phosphate acyltransferase PlsX [Alphaproteobacteria bacterium]
MQNDLVISLDGMGGDNAPQVVVEGAYLAWRKYPQAKFIIFGDENKIRSLIKKYAGLEAVMEVRHTPDRVKSEDKPSFALRNGRNSSMRLAIDAVGRGEANCVVSAGNTGALMAMAKFVLKVLPGVTRPAIATYMPTKVSGHGVVMLDLGANVEGDPKNLLEFGVLGGVFSREILKIANPRIGLLNIGSEAAKGHEMVKGASELFATAAHLPGKYIGFVEGSDINSGTVDVVVTDGFTGNVTLKVIEGTVKLIKSLFKQAFRSSWMMKVGFLLCLPGILVALPAVIKLIKRIDTRSYNGASMMGLKGLCIKSHGGTDGVGFANAIGVAADMALIKFNEKVAHELKELGIGEKVLEIKAKKTMSQA